MAQQVLASKPDYPGLTLRTHRVDGENSLPKVVSQTPHRGCGVYLPYPTGTQIDKNDLNEKEHVGKTSH